MIQTLKGFRDFLPTEVKKRQWLIDTIRNVFSTFGYEPLETPTLEYESLLLGKYGSEADKLIYGFEDKGARRVALRYDQTVPTARVVTQYRNDLTFPFKRYQIQPVWRADKPQKGRYREFLQCDADIIGSKDTTADADILAVYAALYTKIGIDSIKIRVNDRATLLETLTSLGVPENLLFTTIQSVDKLDKKSEQEVQEELEKKGLEKKLCDQIIPTLRKTKPSSQLQTIIEQAINLGVPENCIAIDPTLSRGLDYYTGLIFEGVIPEYLVGSVGGGGRYDSLIKNLIGIDLPAVGFGLGFDRTLEAAEQLGKIPDQINATNVLVTIFSPNLLKDSLRITKQLRENGISSECYPDSEKKMEAQLKYANKKQIPYVIFIGPDETASKLLKIKNMKTGEQESLSFENLIKKLKS